MFDEPPPSRHWKGVFIQSETWFGWLWFECSTMLPICSAAHSARFPPARAESNKKQNNEIEVNQTERMVYPKLAGHSLLTHLRLPDGLDEAGVGQVERRGEVGVREAGVPPLLPEVSVRLVVLLRKREDWVSTCTYTAFQLNLGSSKDHQKKKSMHCIPTLSLWEIGAMLFGVCTHAYHVLRVDGAQTGNVQLQGDVCRNSCAAERKSGWRYLSAAMDSVWCGGSLFSDRTMNERTKSGSSNCKMHGK